MGTEKQALVYQALGYEAWLSAETLMINGEIRKIAKVSDASIDAVLVVGDNFRAAAEAAVFLKDYREKFGGYPKIFCIAGLSTPKAVDYGYDSSFWAKIILIRMGIPKRLVKFYRFSNPKNPLAGVFYFINNMHLSRIAVFSSRGYSLPVAAKLFMMRPEIEWMFFENPHVPLEKRIFEAEILGEEGFAIDAMVSAIFKLRHKRGNMLSPEYKDMCPDNDELKQVLEQGYVLGIKLENLDKLKIDPEIWEQRKKYFADKTVKSYLRQQIEQLISQY